MLLQINVFSRVIPISSNVSDVALVFPSKDMFFFQCFLTLKESKFLAIGSMCLSIVLAYSLASSS